MPSYAILGATGSTGSSILAHLLTRADAHINLYVRSHAKLLQQNPGLEDKKHVRIFAGSMDDISLLADCVRGTDAVFSTVAINENVPHMRIAQHAAQCVVAALSNNLVADPSAKVPRVVVLSAASIAASVLDPPLSAFEHWMFVTAALNYLNDDLRHAEAYYRMHSKWLPVTFAQPANIAHDKARGFDLSTTKYSQRISYADLGAGMVQMADDEQWIGKRVTLKSHEEDKVKQDIRDLGPLMKGVLAHYLPSIYWIGRRFGL
ncbi:MAG: hypothetical protein M1833_004972 [Piccolia ochrophora]|nr:MAG: hypothetical protein M1833_004972 [Piccolia ochrophora]